MKPEILSYSAMFLIGLMGAGHCIGMCGGISAALGLGAKDGKLNLLISYHLGRITSYSLAGCIIGGLGLWGKDYLLLGPVLRILAGVMLVLLGLYLAGWWRVLTRLEQLGSYLWRYLQPLGNKFLPVQYFSQGFLLGVIWGWLPCGLVYSALVYAATAANPLQSATMMLAFGLGTTPAVFLSGVFSGQIKRFLQRQQVRQILALLLIAFGVWTLWGVIPLGGASWGGDSHHGAESKNHSEMHHPGGF